MPIIYCLQFKDILDIGHHESFGDETWRTYGTSTEQSE
jgi:hypothetical protein